MQAYKPYLEFMLAQGALETAYILTHQGAICATNLPIKELPSYHFQLEDENDPSKTHPVVVDERSNLIDALEHNGVCKNRAGIRLYNQKYYPVNFDAENNILYLKKNKGGACVARTKSLILVGTFNSEALMTNGVNQNPGEVNKRVETLAHNLITNGH